MVYGGRMQTAVAFACLRRFWEFPRVSCSSHHMLLYINNQIYPISKAKKQRRVVVNVNVNDKRF